MPVPVSIVIPTWNGLPLLERFLPSVIAAARYRQDREGGAVEIVLVDDGSTDRTVEWARDLGGRSPVPLRVVPHEHNLGFGAAANLGVREAAHPFVWLLNNDIDVDEDAVGRLAAPFERDAPRLLAVHSTMVDLATGEVVGTGKMGRFARGFIRVHRSYIPTSAALGANARGSFISMFATGGSAIVSRALFLELGGFDPIFAPFYMEDVELSYRAWRRGYEVRYAPGSFVRHQFSSTISATDRRRVERISQRNRLVFHWIHLHDGRLFAAHLGWLTVLAVSAPLTQNWPFLGGLADALRQWRTVASLRRHSRAAAVLSDRQVLARFDELDASGDVQSYGEKREVDLARFREDAG